MKKRNHFKRPLAVLLALVMTLALVPVAAAADQRCPEHGYAYERTVVLEATCQKTGLVQYLCPISDCQYGIVETLPIDSKNHDVVYTNNGNGTHSGACRYHTDHTVAASEHKYVNGVCSLCGATDYSAVVMDLPAERIVPIALKDSTAKLSAGNIRLTLGSANITEEYDLSYLWYDYSQNGRQVGSEAEYKLPSSIYGKEGTYYFMLIVNATPKGNITRAPLSQTCRVTVKVEELITASAVMTTEGGELRMGDVNSWTSVSVADQIYDEVQSICGRSAQPAYVVFNDVAATSVGRMNASSTSTQYAFSGTTYAALQDVSFLSSGVSGEFLVSFTAYDTAGRRYSGVLTITVQEYTGEMDVVYVTSRSTPLTLSPKDFEKFWEVVCPGGKLEYITLDQLPRSVDGMMYTEYAASGLTGNTVRVNDGFYVNPGSRQYGISELTFVPSVGVKQQDYITLDFTAYGVRSTGRSTNRSGVMYIFFTETEGAADVSVNVPAAARTVGTVLDPAAFRSAYEKAVGGAGTGFYIQFLDVPTSGGLFINRTTASNGIRLTAATVEGRPFAYSGSKVETIADVTYVPGTAAAESIRYIACSTQGKALFAGNINFTSTAAAAATPATTPAPGDLVKDYNSPATGVTFMGSDFEGLLGTGKAKLTSVCFTPPTALFGTLYYNRTAASAGTAITTSTNWFSVAPTTVSGVNSIDDISFVPALSYTSGIVMIPFTAMTDVGERVNGNVRITVGASGSTPTTNPGTTTPPATTPETTVQPPKTFTDVPKSEYYYQAVTDLTTSGVLSGYEDGTFRPNNTVTLGEALKMIMTSTGYPEQAPTGEGWASGYLSKAKEDNLLPDGIVERLDRPVDRYTIAQITARAMKQQPSAYTESPFADMELTDAAAPSVIALQQIHILVGSVNPNNANQMVYYGKYAIKRCDFAVIIWRVQNYMRTGNAGGNIAA